MRTKRFAWGALALCGAMLTATGSMAQETMSAGEEEYMQACASCHGVSGTGDGPMVPILAMEMPDLTTISARNDGVFPMLEVIQTIDGRVSRATHGYPMPVWGDRFEYEATGGRTYAYDIPFGRELIVRGRVLALAEYIEMLQQ